MLFAMSEAKGEGVVLDLISRLRNNCLRTPDLRLGHRSGTTVPAYERTLKVQPAVERRINADLFGIEFLWVSTGSLRAIMRIARGAEIQDRVGSRHESPQPRATIPPRFSTISPKSVMSEPIRQ